MMSTTLKHTKKAMIEVQINLKTIEMAKNKSIVVEVKMMIREESIRVEDVIRSTFRIQHFTLTSSRNTTDQLQRVRFKIHFTQVEVEVGHEKCEQYTMKVK